jgi:small ligand-binding sensory domain FIST
MEKFRAASCEVTGPFQAEAVVAAARQVREELGAPARMAFAFVSANYSSHLAEFCEILRVDGHIVDVVGCTAAGRIEGSREIEGGSGFTLLALRCDVGDPVALQADDFSISRLPQSPNAWVALANPFVFPIEEWLEKWNAKFPKIPFVGGLASGGGEDDTSVFINGQRVDAVAVPVTGNTTIVPVMSQGCQPIGEPLTVTRAESNVIYSLGGQSAYYVLENAFQTLTDEQKSNARGNLFAGLAGNEYVDEFQSGDFLIKHIIGADPNSGAVVIGGIPRIGQTLQYQLRNKHIALEDLDRACESSGGLRRRAFASLVFSCLGRGQQFFGHSGEDAERLSQATGGKPSAGFFCNGEIAPVRGLNALHGNTAAAAVWVKKSYD